MVPSWFPHATEDHLGDHAEIHLAVLWRDIAVGCVCQAGWLSAGCTRHILIKSQDLPEDVGICLNITFRQTLDFFWGWGEQHLLLLWSPIQQQIF